MVDARGGISYTEGKMRGGNMATRVVLKGYLETLAREEARRPVGERRPVPTLTELAEVAGVTRAWMSNLANGKEVRVNLEILNAVAQELWRRGFRVSVGDLIQMECDA